MTPLGVARVSKRSDLPNTSGSYVESRLCRLMCGKALPFRKLESRSGEAAPRNPL
jgi:hypothetical protein